MTKFETDVIKNIAVLETKMSIIIDKVNDLCDKKPDSGLSGFDKVKYGGLIAALTTLVTVLTNAIQSGGLK